jgi:type II secretory pathway component PulM
MPAIPLHTAVSYVAGAYLVFFALVLVYVAIMATKLSRIESELSELTDLAIRDREARAATSATDTPPTTAAMPAPLPTAAKKTGAIAG